MEIEIYYKFFHWLKFKHPINYEFLKIDFETYIHDITKFNTDILFLIWFKNMYNWLFDDYIYEFLNDEPFILHIDNSNNNVNIYCRWEKGY